MLQIDIKKREISIFQSRFQTRSIISIIFKIGVILYYLSSTPFLYDIFTSYAAEPSFISDSHSESSSPLNKGEEEVVEIERYLQEAQDCFKDGRYEEAITFWKYVLTYYPENQEAKDGIKLAEEKIAKIEAFLGKEQNKILEKYIQEAQSCFKDGRYTEAIKFWEDVLAYDPENQEAKEKIKLAEEKIAKIKTFFGRDVFEEQLISILSLPDCIEIAEDSSLLFQVAKEQINLAKIKVWEARRSFLPLLSLSWAETKGIRSTGKIEGIEYGIEGKQPFYRSGGLFHALAQSKVNLNIAEENYDKLGLDLYFEVAEAYYALVKAKRFLDYTKSIYEKSRPFYDMVKKEYEQALVPDIEYLDVGSKFNKIYYKSIAVENDFEIARLALEQKLNIERAGCIDIEVDILPKSIDKEIKTCLFLAIENRPDLRIGELAVKAAEYDKKMEQAKEMPSVDLAGHYKKSSEVYRESFLGNKPDELDPKKKWYAGLEVTWPILGSTGTYSSYKREDPATLSTYYGSSESKGTSLKVGILDNLKQFSDKKEAEIGYLRAQEELNVMRKKVIKEVKDAFYAYRKACTQLESAAAQREFSEKEINIIKAKHDLGEAKLSDLFTSIIQLMEANETYFEAQKDLYISIAALNKAMGLRDYF